MSNDNLKERVHYYDYFGKEALDLGKKRLFLLDMDGTIYRENALFDGTVQLLDEIKKINGKYVFITNNSSKSVTDYVTKVRKLGIKCDKDDFFTSVQATIMYLRKHGLEKALIYCQGTQSFIKEMEQAGFNITMDVDKDVSVVLVGFDTEITGQKLRNTCEILTTNKDVLYIATNPDLVCPVSFGYVPDCGSMCIGIKNATGREPIVIGKPEPTMILAVGEKYNYSPKDICVIGDRLYTDIQAGLNAKVSSVCVLSGEAAEQDIIYGDITPTYTFSSVKDVFKCIRQVNEGIKTKTLLGERCIRLDKDIQECSAEIESLKISMPK